MGNESSLPSGIKGVKFLEKIGEGSFGKVYKAEWNGETVAAKQLLEYLFLRDDDITNRFHVECQTLLGLNHVNIVKMYQLVEPGGEIPPILVTELLHCDLQTYIKNSTAISNPIIPLQEAVNITLDVAEGLKFLHTRRLPIAHRDLASKNILLTKDRRAKIADLGLARVFVCSSFASPVPGTPLYAAPETFPSKAAPSGFLLNPAYDVRVDVFSFGVLLLEVITGRLPRPDPLMTPVTQAGELIPERQRRKKDIDQMGTGHRLADIVLQCLENDSEARPTTHKIVERLNEEKEKIDRKIRIASSGAAKLKFLALGGMHVGKTCILEKFVNPRFDTELVAPTVGSMGCATTVIHNGIAFSLYLVDTAGQERFNSIPPILFRDLDAILLVFDISDPASFAKIPGVVQLIASHSRFDVSMVLVGNKADQVRQVNQEEAQELARDYAMPYIETSAKTGQNIERLFELVVQMVYDRLDLADIEIYFPSEVPHSEPHSLCGKFAAWFRS